MSAELVGGGTKAFDAVFRDIGSVEFTAPGPFEPGDSVSFGIFPDPSTCPASEVGIHSAVVHYD